LSLHLAAPIRCCSWLPRYQNHKQQLRPECNSNHWWCSVNRQAVIWTRDTVQSGR
jgi:hypothetical protein